MSNYTPEQIERRARHFDNAGIMDVAAMLRDYAATLRQPAARVDETDLPSLDEMLATVKEARMHMAGKLSTPGAREITDCRLAALHDAITATCAALEAALSAQPAERQGESFPMSEQQVRQWIDACNHEPARQVLRDYLRLRTHPAAPVGVPDGDSDRIDWLEANARSVSFGKAPQQGYWVHVQGADSSYSHNESLRGAIDSAREAQAAETAAPSAPQGVECGCRTCQKPTWTNCHFVVCPECGNKRCPHAENHAYVCTGSNEPGQTPTLATHPTERK